MHSKPQHEATGVLRDEHRWILRIADVLELLARDVHVDGAADYDGIEECIRFIRLFAYAYHHAKEVDLLFTELEGVGMSRTSGPIAVMLHEHMLGREYVSAMADALEGARRGDATSIHRLVNAARSYVELIRNHILKEDHVLFNMADQMLDAPACKRLCERYDDVCAGRFDGCTKAQLEALATDLMARYPV